MYTAAVLTQNSSDLLLWIMRGTLNLENKGYFAETAQGQYLPHHMTINMGRIDESLNHHSIVGLTAKLQVDSLIYDDAIGVCAAKVIDARCIRNAKSQMKLCCKNSHPHITVCLKVNSKPVESNLLFKEGLLCSTELQLDKTYELDAVIREV